MSPSGIHVPRMPGASPTSRSTLYVVGSGFTVSSPVNFTLDHGVSHMHRKRSLHAWSSSRSRAWNLFFFFFLFFLHFFFWFETQKRVVWACKSSWIPRGLETTSGCIVSFFENFVQLIRKSRNVLAKEEHLIMIQHFNREIYGWNSKISHNLFVHA